jgi:hypothetical protein
MTFKEIAKKSGRSVAVAAALLGAVSLTAAPGAAYARDHGGWQGGGGWHGHRGGGWGGAGIGLGILGGALAGAAIANSYGYSYPYYGYSYPYYGGGYYAPYYGYGYGY